METTLIDFFVSLTGLLLISPFFLLLVIVLYFAIKMQEYFLRRNALGKNRVEYLGLFKFKTMTDCT